MGGEEKVNSILDSTKGFRKFRGEIGAPSFMIQRFRFRRAIHDTRKAACKQRDHR